MANLARRTVLLFGLSCLQFNCVTKSRNERGDRPPASPAEPPPVARAPALPTVVTASAEAKIAGNSEGAWTAGPGLAACNARKTSWIATTPDGRDGACGSPLVAWCCSEAMAYSAFPSARTALSTEFSAIKGRGLKLYNCSADAGRTAFHWAVRAGDTIRYTVVTIAGAELEEPSPPWVCDRIKAKDLNL